MHGCSVRVRVRVRVRVHVRVRIQIMPTRTIVPSSQREILKNI